MCLSPPVTVTMHSLPWSPFDLSFFFSLFGPSSWWCFLYFLLLFVVLFLCFSFIIGLFLCFSFIIVLFLSYSFLSLFCPSLFLCSFSVLLFFLVPFLSFSFSLFLFFPSLFPSPFFVLLVFLAPFLYFSLLLSFFCVLLFLLVSFLSFSLTLSFFCVHLFFLVPFLCLSLFPCLCAISSPFLGITRMLCPVRPSFFISFFFINYLLIVFKSLSLSVDLSVTFLCLCSFLVSFLNLSCRTLFFLDQST
jgi:hypothetical protein